MHQEENDINILRASTSQGLREWMRKAVSAILRPVSVGMYKSDILSFFLSLLPSLWPKSAAVAVINTLINSESQV